MKLLEEEYGEVTYEASVPCLILRWKGFANSTQFRSLLEKGLALYKEKSKVHSHLGWVADTRKLSAVHEGDYNWLKTDWEPRLYAAGVQGVAMVQPETIVGEIALQRYSQEQLLSKEEGIKAQVFTTLQDAKDWTRETCLAGGYSSG